MTTPMQRVIQELIADKAELTRKLHEERARYKELEQCYACAITDLEHTRKELLRATS
jgi:hypothetical protein